MSKKYQARYTFQRQGVEVVVNLELDMDEIARQLGQRAAANRSGIATILGGAIKVKVEPTNAQ